MSKAKGFLSESCKYVCGLAPIDTTGSAWETDVVNMANYTHATVVVQMGAWAGGTSTITVEYCDDNTPTTDTPMAFKYKTGVLGGEATDVLGALTAVGSGGVAASVANTTYVIEIDAADIASASSGANSRFVVGGTTPGSNADLISVAIFMTNPRYAGDVPQTAID